MPAALQVSSRLDIYLDNLCGSVKILALTVLKKFFMGLAVALKATRLGSSSKLLRTSISTSGIVVSLP